MRIPPLLAPACALGLLAFDRSAADRLACAPAADAPLTLASSMSLRSEFVGASIQVQGNDLPPEAVIQNFDEDALSGGREVAAELRLVSGGGDERTLWLTSLALGAEEPDGIGELEVGQGVRFARADGDWSGEGVDEDGEPLDADVGRALSPHALFEALLPPEDVEPGDSWEVEFDGAAVAGLLLPGLGFELVPDLMPSSDDGEDDPADVNLGDALRAQMPRLLAENDSELEFECRYVALEDGLARLEFSGEGVIELDLSEPFAESIQVGSSTDETNAAEATATAEIELELGGTLVWDVEGARPVEHALEGTFGALLLVEASAPMGETEIPITAEFEWEGDLASEAAIE